MFTPSGLYTFSGSRRTRHRRPRPCEIYPPSRRLSRDGALRHMTAGSAWMSDEESDKGNIAPGQLADLAVLSQDYLSVHEVLIPETTSVLTLVGGKVVHAEAEHCALNPPVLPGYSPLAVGTDTL
ncbi:amidohydrolase family protein [Kibdelosporangium aridum]|uniref:amidohydrolase family protein n=1 Tax=Kibdelosporangium aridum TaxID=2030 RepID=UPI0035ECD429